MRKVIINEVNRLIKTYHTRNPFEIAEMMNIEIVYHDLGNLKGYYFYQSKFRYIVINENISEEMQTVICAHELGHDRFHQHLAKNDPIKEFTLFDITSKPEREANLFTAELLIPDESIMCLVHGDCTYNYIAAQLNIPIEIVDFKSQLLKNKGYRIDPLSVAKGDFLKY